MTIHLPRPKTTNALKCVKVVRMVIILAGYAKYIAEEYNYGDHNWYD